jgi:hypothetical protein
MKVKFTPDLKEQLKDKRVKLALPSKPCIIMVCNASGRNPVPRVDPITRLSTGEAQQFLKHTDGSLTIVRRSQWVDDPEVVEVDYMRLG